MWSSERFFIGSFRALMHFHTQPLNTTEKERLIVRVEQRTERLTMRQNMDKKSQSGGKTLHKVKSEKVPR